MKNGPNMSNLPREDRELLRRAGELLNQREFSTAIQAIRERLGQGVDPTPGGVIFRAELAGLLIDIGGEGQLRDAVTEGLHVLEADAELLKSVVLPSSYEYNLGNAKLALFDIEARSPGFQQNLQSTETLVAAKNHFWKAYKLQSPSIGDLRFSLLVNLGNALASSNRIVEALNCYQRVLSEAPDFGMAHLQLAWGLIRLRRLTRRGSKRLAQQAIAEFHQAAGSAAVPPAARKQARDMEAKLTNWLQSKGSPRKDLPLRAAEAQAESTSHSAYRRFCLANGLALCEHALYCSCSGSRRDNLMVATREEPLAGTFVPGNELLLNRLKAEFGWARLQFYQSSCDPGIRWDLHEHDVTYTELFEGEAIGMCHEMLRSSFRLCFGVLDRIAVGISDLFGVADPGENLSFESFWRPRGNVARWEKLNAISGNPALIALYSQATDLNQANGEWGDFKRWRNALEHRMLLLSGGTAPGPDPYSVLNGPVAPVIVSEAEFRERTLHLLQMTCSAIFSFVFCVREEARKLRHEREAARVTLEYKKP